MRTTDTLSKINISAGTSRFPICICKIECDHFKWHAKDLQGVEGSNLFKIYHRCAKLLNILNRVIKTQHSSVFYTNMHAFCTR